MISSLKIILCYPIEGTYTISIKVRGFGFDLSIRVLTFTAKDETSKPHALWDLLTNSTRCLKVFHNVLVESGEGQLGSLKLFIRLLIECALWKSICHVYI